MSLPVLNRAAAILLSATASWICCEIANAQGRPSPDLPMLTQLPPVSPSLSPATGPVLPTTYPVAGAAMNTMPPQPAVPPGIPPGSEPVPAGVGEPTELNVDYWYEPRYWFPKKLWSGGAEIGINGTEGNSQSFSMRAGANGKRTTDRTILALDLIYNKANADGIDTANNGLLTANNDWLFGDSPWTLFANFLAEYDEFRPFDLRVALNGGVGFQLIKTENASLIGRLGSGVSKEIGSVDDDVIPEAVFGGEYEHQLSKRQKVALKVDYYPEWGDFENFRMLTDASWEVLLDEATNMSLKVSVIDRYDATPGDGKPNDVDYALLLLWKI